MTQFAPPTTARQGSITPLSVTEPWLDVEVLAERFETLAAFEAEREDEPPEEADDPEDETPTDDDLPF